MYYTCFRILANHQDRNIVHIFVRALLATLSDCSLPEGPNIASTEDIVGNRDNENYQ